MSDIRDAVDHLRLADAKLGDELLALEARREKVLAAREAIRVLIDGDAAPTPSPTHKAPAPAASSKQPSASSARETGIKHVDAANRLLRLLEKKGTVPAAEAFAVTKLPNKFAFNRLTRTLIGAKRIARTGATHSVRYSLVGQPPAADTEGD